MGSYGATVNKWVFFYTKMLSISGAGIFSEYSKQDGLIKSTSNGH